MLSADVYRVVKRVLRREHEPTIRTITFSMVDGKWTRVSERTVRRDRRATERRKNDRRKAARHDVPETGRVEAPERLRKAARVARKKK